MFDSIDITGFRGHRRRTLGPFTRLNLLVGPNNAGKTAVLDALSILASDGSPTSLAEVAWLRAGAGVDFQFPRTGRIPDDARHLFHGFGQGSPTCTLAATGPGARSLDLVWRDGGMDVGRDSGAPTPTRPIPCERVSAAGTTASLLYPLWARFVGNPEEDDVIRAMRILFPEVERIVFAPTGEGPALFVRLRGVRERVPLAALGEGPRRVLGLAIRAVQARGGVLLLDEVDGGLHHSTLDGLWRWLARWADTHDIQVFATAHGADCVHALGWLHRREPTMVRQVSLHRVDPLRIQAPSYTPAEVDDALAFSMELRG